MIGVDVVDLSDPLLKERTGKEMRFISHPEDASTKEMDCSLGRLFWAFWAAKEAVFKTHRLASGFSPKEIQIEFTSLEDNELAFRGYWHTKAEGVVFLGSTEVLALATTGLLQQVCFARYSMVTKIPSPEIRTKFSAALPAGWSLDADGGNLPVLTNKQVTVPVSFSHHHQLGASAWLKLADSVE